METIRSISEIIDIAALQKMQDDFAKAVGMAFISVDYKGNPITKQSGFTEFCDKGRHFSDFKGLCYQCDAHGGLHAAITGKPHIYKCHADLIDFAVPLIFEGNYYGAIMGGQIHSTWDSKDAPEKLERIIDRESQWNDKLELVSAYEKVKTISFDKIESVVALMFEHTQSLLERGQKDYLAETLKQKELELLEERSGRLETEKRLKEKQQHFSNLLLKPVSLFSNLSIISRLAFIENAQKTESAIYLLSDMLRYTLEKRESRISTLGDELRYIENYLNMERIKEERICFTIDVPEELYNITCPFMIIQPIVENAISYTIDSKKEDGVIKITCISKKEDIILSIENQGSGISQETMDTIMSEDVMIKPEADGYDLHQINKNLIGLFGKKYMLHIENLPNGTIIQLRLPMKINRIK